MSYHIKIGGTHAYNHDSKGKNAEITIFVAGSHCLHGSPQGRHREKLNNKWPLPSLENAQEK